MAVKIMYLHVFFLASTTIVYATEDKKDNITTETSNRFKVSWGQGDPDYDLFFDGVVVIMWENGELASTGILMYPTLILTSFNPFRKFYKPPVNLKDNVPPGHFPFGEMKVKIKIVILIGRTINKGGNQTYNTKEVEPVCLCRAMAPYSEDRYSRNQWHGVDKKLSPLHDLMVIAINKKFTPYLEYEPGKFSLSLYQEGVPSRAGPMRMWIAYDHKLGGNVKIASMFLNNKRHDKGLVLKSRQYEEDDDVVQNCDEWFTKQWGYFICILNIDNYKTLHSGAVLAHNDIVFGIGSFLLKKGNQSVLVFTDVRPYNPAFTDCIKTVEEIPV